MTIANGKKMLVVSLANIGRQYEIVLVLFVYVVDAEAFSSGVCESSDHIVLDYF